MSAILFRELKFRDKLQVSGALPKIKNRKSLCLGEVMIANVTAYIKA